MPVAAVPIAAGTGPPLEASLLFGLLCGTYVLAFSFALDLNRPFDGVYQVRRSAAAAHLLVTQKLLEPHLPDARESSAIESS